MKRSNRRIVFTVPFLLDLLKVKFPYIDFVGTPYTDYDRDCICVNIYVPMFEAVKDGEVLEIIKPESLRG